MDISTLTFIGRDSGFGEKNNSAYFEYQNELYLIDCGFTVFENIIKKFDFKKYSKINIVITHLHNDHAGSLSQVILYLWFIHNIKTNVICKCERIKDYLNITGTPEESYKIFDELNILKFVKTEHVKHLDAYGFILRINEKRIVYTGDTCTLEPFMPFLDIADELYVDVSKFGGAHLKIDDIYGSLHDFKTNGTEIYLMHLDDKNYIKNATNNEFNYE